MAFERPKIPVHRFVAERDKAFAPDTSTGFIELDLRKSLDFEFTGTTPLLQLRFARIRQGETLKSSFNASTESIYVIRGRGQSQKAGDRIEWAEGDVFCFPGGGITTHESQEDSILLVVTNDPLLAFEHARAPIVRESPFQAVHYPAEEIRCFRHQLLIGAG